MSLTTCRFYSDEDGFGGGLIAAICGVANGNEDVCFREIGCGATKRDLVLDYFKTRGAAGFFFKVTHKINPLAVLDAEPFDVLAIEEDDAASVRNSAIAIALAVDRSIELIVAANGGQQKLPVGSV